MPSTTSRTARCGWRSARRRCRRTTSSPRRSSIRRRGFYNFGVRYLDPRFSKWMTADPALGGYLSANKLAPATLALYTYGLHNPAKFNDPSGALPDDPNNTASQSTYLALGQWPRLYKQVLASNNVRLKDLEDAAIEGRLKDIGSFPGKNLWGMIGEALEADRIMATGQSRSGFTVIENLKDLAPLPKDKIPDVIGEKLPDLFVTTTYGPNTTVSWRAVIGPTTGGQIGTELMSTPGKAGVVTGIIEVTLATNPYLDEKARVVVCGAGSSPCVLFFQGGTIGGDGGDVFRKGSPRHGAWGHGLK